MPDDVRNPLHTLAVARGVAFTDVVLTILRDHDERLDWEALARAEDHSLPDVPEAPRTTTPCV